MTDERGLDTDLTNFNDEGLKSLYREKQKKLDRRHKMDAAIDHLKKFFLLGLETIDTNSIEFTRFYVLIRKVLRQMETEDLCYWKIVNGKTRIFKKRYCCLGLDEWKKCPEYRCPGWPYCQDFECPHNPTEWTPEMKNAESVK